MQKEGVAELHYLTKEEIGLSMDAMVEGVHPNDLPCKQRHEPDMYEWNTRHEQILKMNREQTPKIVMIGNSITHYWAEEPIAPLASGQSLMGQTIQRKNSPQPGLRLGQSGEIIAVHR